MPGRLDKSDGRVNYQYSADPKRACQYCVNFIPADPDDLYEGGACRKVVGDIRAIDTCALWTPSRGKRAEAIGDAKFPEPIDAWQTSEDDDGGDAPWPVSTHQHASAAVEALHAAGWRPVTNAALRWRHSQLAGHEIEVTRTAWVHTADGRLRASGGHHELAGYVKDMTTLQRRREAAKQFDRVYED